MSNDDKPKQITGAHAGRPFRVQLPGFVIKEEVGLGDLIKSATSVAGIRPCGGCSRRASALNGRIVLAPRRK